MANETEIVISVGASSTPTVDVSRGSTGPAGPKGDTGATGVVSATDPLTYDSATRTVGLDYDVTDLRYLRRASNLGDISGDAASRLNLGLGSTDSPTFAGLSISGLTASLPVVTDGSKALASLAYTGATSFRKNLGLETSDSPTFAGLSLTGFSGVLKATTGTVGGSATMDDIADGTTYKRSHNDFSDTYKGYLNQSVQSGASPTFAGLSVDTQTIYVDSTHHRVGINNNAPQSRLDISALLRVGAASDADLVVPTSGISLEIFYASVADQGGINCYDRTNSLYKPFKFGANPVTFGVDLNSAAYFPGKVKIGATSHAPDYLIDLGDTYNSGDAARKLALFNGSGSFYGFGISAGVLEISVGKTTGQAPDVNITPGKMGIGKVPATDALEVAGNIRSNANVAWNFGALTTGSSGQTVDATKYITVTVGGATAKIAVLA